MLRRADGIRWWQWPFRKRWQREADGAEARLKECRSSLQETCENLKPLPTSRYYVSEWYQCTRIPLANSEPTDGPQYRLEASFTPGGLFRLHGEYRSRAERNRAEMRSYGSAHQKSRGGTRSRSARKHQMAKKQHDRKDVKRSRRSRGSSIDDEWGWYLDGGGY